MSDDDYDSTSPEAPDIFGYTDYRAFLGDYYSWAKRAVDGFSYRYFAKKAGYSSPNFLKLVIDGKRNLGAGSVRRFSRVIGLQDEEARHFEALVDYSQAEDPEQKSEAYNRIAAGLRYRQARRVDQTMILYLSRWYYPAIREMTARDDFQEDPGWIANELLPPIAPDRAREALDLLLELGLIVREEDGSLGRGEPALSTGHEARALAVGQYHRQMTRLAIQSIESTPSSQRDITGVTVGIKASSLPELKDQIRDFRERFIARCDDDGSSEAVYQFNIQLFPLTRVTLTEDPEGSGGNDE